MFIDDTEYLQHYGTPRRSGRYPWGSGGDAPRNSRDFLSMVDSLKKKGLSEKEISEGFAISMVELRAAKSVATAEKKAADTAAAQRFKDKGMANSAIGERLGVSEATVRNLLAPGAAHKADVLAATVSLLKDQVDSGHYIDVGKGTENYLNVSPERLKVALAVMKQDGYEVITNIPVNQPGTGNTTKMKVLAEPGTTWGDVVKNKGNIRQFNEHLDETGASRLGIIAPKVLNPNRVDIVYASDGGSHADGVMYVRPGVEDVSLGGSRYAQVRVQVGKDRYLKGMAMYKDDLPEGIDVQFNTTINTTYTKFYRFFCSPPLASDQTVGGGNATLNVADSHDASSQNHWIDGINLYVWRPSTGALVGTLKDAGNLGGSEPTANDSIQVTHITGITTSAVNGLAGDVIICEIWADTFVEANRSNANHRFYYDGTTENTTENAVVSNHASYIELAEDLVFEGEGGGKGFPFQPPMRGFIHMLVR